jgi:subtilisin family serine protease
MASPHVAGVAALFLQRKPTSTPQIVRDSLVANATASKVTSAGSGSPNRLLFSNY